MGPCLRLLGYGLQTFWAMLPMKIPEAGTDYIILDPRGDESNLCCISAYKSEILDVNIFLSFMSSYAHKLKHRTCRKMYEL